MSKFLNNKYKGLIPYVPGEQPKEKRYIKLNTNESPFPPAIALKYEDFADVADNMRLYPDPEAHSLKAAIADFYKVKPNEIFIGNGSDECLYYSFMAFCEAGVSFPDLTYGFYKVYADINAVKADIIPLRDDFTIAVSDYEDRGTAIVIANPNAPTGIMLGKEEIRKLLCKNPDKVVIIDEAYIDFAPEGSSAIDLVGEYDNLLVIQTFSKSRSLAGARVGYAIGNAALIEDLERLRFSVNPYNISSFSLAAAVEAVENAEYFRENCRKIKENREYTRNELIRLGFEVIDSHANFLLAKTERISGVDFYEKLRENGILVRHFENKRIADYNRISIGSMEDMKAFIRAAERIIESRIAAL